MTVYVSNYLEGEDFLMDDPLKNEEFKSRSFMTEQVLRGKVWEMKQKLNELERMLMNDEPNFYCDPTLDLLHFEDMFSCWEDLDAMNDQVHDLTISAYKSYIKEWRKFEKSRDSKVLETKEAISGN